jgi:dTDP-4-dehydrorhamnose 3,5-epimerase
VFQETFHEDRYRAVGIDVTFRQDNLSRSKRNVLRGLHFQYPYGQSKLVYVVEGEVYDVVVDIRLDSPGFGKWHGELLTAANRKQMFVPEGFAHGFLVLSEMAVFAYKCSEVYHPEAEKTLRYNDPALGISWPVSDPILSDKDRAGLTLEALAELGLPKFEP